MKKTYIMPSLEEVKTSGLLLLKASGISSESGIGFGGVDTSGSHDPDAPAFDIPSEDF